MDLVFGALREASIAIHSEIQTHVGLTGQSVEELMTKQHQSMVDSTLAAQVDGKQMPILPLGRVNESGDHVLALDELADKHVENALRACPVVVGFASEERAYFIEIERENEEQQEQQGEVGNNTQTFIVVYDPLDGSQNVPVGLSVGAIFGIFRARSLSDVRTGDDLVGAACALFSAGLTFVCGAREQPNTASENVCEECCSSLSTSSSTSSSSASRSRTSSSTSSSFESQQIEVGCVHQQHAGTSTSSVKVQQYCFDSRVWATVLSHHRLPGAGKTYAINEGNSQTWDATVKEFISTHMRGKRSVRWMSCMAADVQRQLLQGGAFLYPADLKYPDGRLRLLYEAAPLALLWELAGGEAWCTSDGQRILNRPIKDDDVHERCGVIYLGPSEAVSFADVVKKQRKEQKRTERFINSAAMVRAKARVDDLQVLLSGGSSKDMAVAAGAAAAIAVAIVGLTQVAFSLLARAKR